MIKTGLAAFGMSGKIFHAPFITQNPDFDLVAILERNKELSKEEYPDVSIVRSFDELINNNEIDLIIINTPDKTHYEYSKRALCAGKHVIVEKPFTSNAEQAMELQKIAESKNLLLCVFQNRRWDSDFLTVKKIIEDGSLGRLVEFESTFPRYRNFIKTDTWKETGIQGGGLVYNLGSHLIDQAISLFGVPEAVYAEVDILRDNGIVDDYFNIHLIRPSKSPQLKITLKSSYLMCTPEPRFILHGTEGSFVKYGFDRQEEDLNNGLRPTYPEWGEEKESNYGTLHTFKDNIDKVQKIKGISGNYGNFYKEVANFFKHGVIPSTTAANIIPTMKIIEACYKSAETCKVISVYSI